ncbi:GNAT family N-acetyltransferase [Rhodococcus sp. T7]|uniref:GNAT family N-acetyltransferase n=1 Tax=Rhodococcus sp. T7 TaxID=627444 RepID=UPI0013584D5C|nr:GNAT family N-acetyltransferase [Rhodococcus sp. T7]KAF0957329.1 Ubiquinone/menaquinone biosynthesis C-methyltransferase UbiE [Rhodococcus sp. T7]KAF0959178.1 Ubiquinone/menaquinone biosynthesis C-methyltransferase UbiE [Rhodococcus sp. T7]
MPTQPDSARSMLQYRLRADGYDRRLSSRLANFRAQALELLDLAPGQTVLEVGCGTGRNFAGVLEKIGPSGQLIGVDQSADMLKHSQAKLDANGWVNVRLIYSSAETASLAALAVDRILFYATHDILRSRAAVLNTLSAAGRRTRVVAVGTQWAPTWNVVVNGYLWWTSRRYITTFEGYHGPWTLLREYVPDMCVDTARFKAVYLAYGSAPIPGELQPPAIIEVTRKQLSEVVKLLVEAELSIEGVHSGGRYWLAYDSARRPVGVVGLEAAFGRACLLRSLAVMPKFRRRGWGNALARRALTEARLDGRTAVYALSTGATELFRGQGFQPIPIDELASAVSNTPQVCAYRAAGMLSTELAWRRRIDIP